MHDANMKIDMRVLFVSFFYLFFILNCEQNY